jgi:hypothetical protein
MEFYSCDPDETEYHKIIQNLYHVESSITALSVEDSTELSGTLTASEGYEITSVVILMGNEDITSTAYTELTGEISISSVTNDVTIVATARAT